MQAKYPCIVCGGPGETKHHLVPKLAMKRADLPIAGRNRQLVTIRLCRNCHRDVHYYFSPWELATQFYEASKLVAVLKIRKTADINNQT